jgi:hypothetical protein
MTRLRRALAALRGFARGFLGLAAARDADADAARTRIRDTAARRPHCC